MKTEMLHMAGAAIAFALFWKIGHVEWWKALIAAFGVLASLMLMHRSKQLAADGNPMAYSHFVIAFALWGALTASFLLALGGFKMATPDGAPPKEISVAAKAIIIVIGAIVMPFVPILAGKLRRKLFRD